LGRIVCRPKSPRQFARPAGGFNKTTAFTGSPPNRVVILRFDGLDKVKAWEDGGARDLQEKVGAKYADFQYVLAVEGVDGM